ncbi:hypothetical protein [Bacillus paranthracis]|uniref:hypothetical protein n=1 Tax=Bacillus paranthracis TaxID=2026186 RepID=UPI003CFB4E7E
MLLRDILSRDEFREIHQLEAKMKNSRSLRDYNMYKREKALILRQAVRRQKEHLQKQQKVKS